MAWRKFASASIVAVNTATPSPKETTHPAACRRFRATESKPSRSAPLHFGASDSAPPASSSAKTQSPPAASATYASKIFSDHSKGARNRDRRDRRRRKRPVPPRQSGQVVLAPPRIKQRRRIQPRKPRNRRTGKRKPGQHRGQKNFAPPPTTTIRKAAESEGSAKDAAPKTSPRVRLRRLQPAPRRRQTRATKNR